MNVALLLHTLLTVMCAFKAMGPREYWWRSWKSKSLLSTLKFLSQVCHCSDRRLTTCLRCLGCLQMLSVTSKLHPIRSGSRLSLGGSAKPEELHRTWLWNLIGFSSFSHFQTTITNSWIEFKICLGEEVWVRPTWPAVRDCFRWCANFLLSYLEQLHYWSELGL